jgi:hypothetical protein
LNFIFNSLDRLSNASVFFLKRIGIALFSNRPAFRSKRPLVPHGRLSTAIGAIPPEADSASDSFFSQAPISISL